MRNTVFVCLMMILTASCKNETQTEVKSEEAFSKSYDQNDGLVTMRGDFIYMAKDNAAVLQTKSDIYGVIVNDKMHELNTKVAEYKNQETDMVPVTVRVKRSESTEANTWKYKVEIKDILKVEAPAEDKDDVIKLSN
ncbi:MAG: hypothetical protein AAF901_06560 [Bacteroidota bacterium]